MTQIFAHRGASYRFPENTMPAFQLADEEGADGIELDVQLTRDRVPVVIHDEYVDRTTDGKGLVSAYKWAELKKLRAYRPKSFDKTHAPIPTLDEVLEWALDTSLIINIELKNDIIDYKGMEEMVIKRINELRLMDRTIFSSFKHASMRTVKEIDATAETAIIYSKAPVNVGPYTHEMGAGAVHPSKRHISLDFINAMHAQGLKVRPWTVNSPSAIKKMASWGIDGIFTDAPGKAIQTVQELEK